MRQLVRYIWVARFLCLFALVLALLFARQLQKLEKENQLATLAAEKTATSAAASVFIWQKEQAQKLRNYTMQLVGAEGQPALLDTTGSFQAVFVTDSNGVLALVEPSTYLNNRQGFLKPTRGQLTAPFTLFLPEPYAATALAMPYNKNEESFVLYAVVRPENIALFLRESSDSLLTILDGNENVVLSQDGRLKAGSNRLQEQNAQYVALGGGYFEKAGEQPAIAYRTNTRGFFGWSVFCEVPVRAWPYGYVPVYMALFSAAAFLALALFLQRLDGKQEQQTEAQTSERARQLKERVKKLIEQDRN